MWLVPFTCGVSRFTMMSSDLREGDGPWPCRVRTLDELAKFGYKQELDRSLGLFSSFAAGFSYISIMTGVFQLFFFGFASGGPAFIWTWPLVFVGQLAVALCFAELAGQFPLAGSVYQWSNRSTGRSPRLSAAGSSWARYVTAAAVAVAYQVIPPQISSAFEIVGGSPTSAWPTPPRQERPRAGRALIVFTTVINMVGVKMMAKINNFGVRPESCPVPRS